MKRYFFIIIAISVFGQNTYAQSLEPYFKIAAENNPGLLAKFKSFEAAMQKVSQVGSLPDPSLSLGYFISPVETRVGPQWARFSLSQSFPWFGTLKAQENAASLAAEAKFQEFLDVRNKLYYEVAASYFPLFELQGHIAVERENIDILYSYKTIALAKFEHSKGTMVDVLRVDMMLKDAQTELSILEKKLEPFKTRLLRLLNKPDSFSIAVEDTLFMQNLQNTYRRDSLLVSNPQLMQLDFKRKASEAAAQVAQKQGMPKIGVGLDYIIVGERTDMAVSENGKDVLMPMVTLSLPIFRKKYKAAQQEAELMQEAYTLQQKEVANRLESAYEMAWFEIDKQRALLDLYEEQIQTSEQSLDLLMASYGNSGEGFEEVLRMQQQLLKYRKLSASALSAYHIALAELDYITAKSR